MEGLTNLPMQAISDFGFTMDICNKLGRLLLWAVQETQHATKIKASKWIKRRSPNTRFLVSLGLVLTYGCLLSASSEWSSDHAEIGSIHVLTFLPTVYFIFSLFAKKSLIIAFHLLSSYGWFRVLVYGLFLVVFSYVFSAVVLDKSALVFAEKLTDFFVSRFDKNIMGVKENRAYTGERTSFHPLSAGETQPQFLQQLIRYPMEDVQMNCSTLIAGYPGGRPFINQVEWRRNGVPLQTMTDRHSHVTQFTELPSNHPDVNQTFIRSTGLAAYEVKSSLSIYLLEDEDFGSYTCHMIEKVNIPVKEWESKTGRKFSPKTDNGKKKHTKGGDQDEKADRRAKPKSSFSGKQCTCQPERKYFFQDVHSHTAEFRLIKMKPSSVQIEAPAGSILFFTVAYLHLSQDDEVRSEYTINDASLFGLCSDRPDNPSYGCSKLQKILTYLIYDEKVWWFLWFLPLQSYIKDGVADNIRIGHCLCEKSFGKHSIKFWRKYYNRTTEKYSFFEVIHPQELLVRPLRHNTSNIFSFIWDYGPIRLLPLADYWPESAYALTSLTDLAVLSAMFLDVTDALFISAGLTVLVCVSIFVFYTLRIVGLVSKRLCLQGSMGYLSTAITAGKAEQNDKDETVEETDEEKFDVFLCHSDAAADHEVIISAVLPLLEPRLGLKVCLRDRDLPPNELELVGLSRAMNNSKCFIIFLSKDLLQDKCRNRETAMISETLFDRPSKLDAVLVIRLDDSQKPVQWVDFSLQDWTTANLSLEDHQLRLVQWVTSQVRQTTALWSVSDVFMTTSPLMLVLVHFVYLWFSG